jgi:transposase InsO family protein
VFVVAQAADHGGHAAQGGLRGDYRYTLPGKPNQNAYIERFDRTYRDEVLDRHLFVRLDEVREATWKFLIDYNEHGRTTRSMR